jgi:hypothetical protein
MWNTVLDKEGLRRLRYYFHCYIYILLRIQDSSVGKVTGWDLIPDMSRDSALFHRIQNGSSFQQASYPMGKRTVYPGVKWPIHELSSI